MQTKDIESTVTQKRQEITTIENDIKLILTNVKGEKEDLIKKEIFCRNIIPRFENIMHVMKEKNKICMKLRDTGLEMQNKMENGIKGAASFYRHNKNTIENAQPIVDAT